MARPERHDADYFPFYVKDGKTLFILESKYGLLGIGFFTNLMRFLTRQNDHHICIREESDRLYFFAQLRCQEDIGIDMINLMVKTSKIDAQLWNEQRVIASKDLLESLKDAYKNRNNHIVGIDEIRVSYQDNPITYQSNAITSPDNPQRKGKERKGKESKTRARENKTLIPVDFNISERVKRWAVEKGHSNLDEHLESFKLSCEAKRYENYDWDAAFMKAIRENWAKIGGQTNGNRGIRTARSDPRDNTLQHREDAELAAIFEARAAAKASSPSKPQGNT